MLLLAGERQEVEEEFLSEGTQLWDHRHCELF